jgi:hypothetical protein
MRKFPLIAVLGLGLLPLLAHASCDDVKSQIDAKLKAKGLSAYSLDVVPADQSEQNGGKVVGQCEDGKKIVYTRGVDSASSSNGQSGNGAPPSSSSSSGG